MAKSKLVAAFILIFLFLTVFVYYGCQISEFFFEIYENPDKNNNNNQDMISTKEPEGRINVLLLGIDARKNEPSRSDTIMIASFDPVSDEIILLSVPRDSRVNIPGRGLDKINHAHAFGGVHLTIETVEKFLNIPINYYARVNFQGFIDMVDTLGGVYLEVEPHIANLTPLLYGKGGFQLLNGRETLEYVRFRKDGYGDIGRVQRQQKFLVTLAKESVRAGNILKAPALLDILGNNLRTNMPLSKMIDLGRRLNKMDIENIQKAYIPGSAENIDGISYWIVDQAEMVELMKELGFWENRFYYGDTKEVQNYENTESCYSGGRFRNPLSTGY